MTGVGFIGAGAIIRGRRPAGVRNLTTAATVWVTAGLVVACALAAWEVVLIGAALHLLVLCSGPTWGDGRYACSAGRKRRSRMSVWPRPTTCIVSAANADGLAPLRLRLLQRPCLILEHRNHGDLVESGSFGLAFATAPEPDPVVEPLPPPVPFVPLSTRERMACMMLRWSWYCLQARSPGPWHYGRRRWPRAWFRPQIAT
ncbi:MAG: MgtC/SapB family protein [Geminicoccaceae bacterium]